MGFIEGSSSYGRVLKEKFTGHPKLHPQMVMFVLETMVPWVELKGVSASCDNISALHVTV